MPRWLAEWLHLDVARPLWHVPDLLVQWGGPEAYRWLYPALAIIGGVAIILLKFIRVRGDKLLTRQILEEGELGPIDPRARALEPYSLTAVLTPSNPYARWCRS